MVETFSDRFNRADGEIGSDYTVPCGDVFIFDESVLPVKVEAINGSEVVETPSERTQVIYTADTMDNPDQVLRAVWGHDDVVPSGVDTAPSFTILARASKDPLVIDLAPPDESPDCLDQFYGLRVTCPLDGTNPILKIVKKQPRNRMPGLSNPTSTEPDFAQVLTSVTLVNQVLTQDPDWDGTTPASVPYKGFWQDMRLRIRRGDNEVVLEAYFNDIYLNTPILTFTDQQDPLWSVVGVPGFEFLSAVLSSQPADASPFAQSAEALMRCSLFSTQTLKDVRRPNQVAPANHFTYDRVVDRVILLVEKDGDAKYTATNSGATKRQAYLQFVLEAEAEIIREEGYYHWLRRTQRVFLVDQQTVYELPENTGEIQMVRPGNFVAGPLREMEPFEFHQAVAGRTTSGGKPSVYILDPESVNNRPSIRLFPSPLVSSIDIAEEDLGPYLEVDYYARQLYPSDPSMQIPFVPQQHIDVLIYGAAALALVLDTDPANRDAMMASFNVKKAGLRRENNRKVSGRQTIARSAADVFPRGGSRTRVPLLRASQLDNFLP
jgi:hypothetical protein